MNENPGGTPNPLNPNVGPVPTPEPLSANPAEPVAPAAPAPTPVNPAPAEPVAAPVEPAAPATSVEALAAAETPATEVTAPADSVVADKPKKKKTGLIIGIIVFILLLAGGGVAAAYMLGLFGGGDPVAAAMAKMMGDKKPENISVNGSITVVPDDQTTGISQVKIDLKSSMKTNSMINSTTATLTASTAMGDIEVSLGEVYAANGDLYINISGVDNVVDMFSNPTSLQTNNLTEGLDESLSEDLTTDELDVTDCLSEDEDGCGEVTTGIDLSGISDVIVSILGAVDGEWIRIPTENITDMTTTFGMDSSTQCLINAAKDAAKNGNSIAEIYSKNAFVSGTTENVKVAKKNDPIYKVVLDSEKMTAFLDAVDGANLYGDSSCLGTSGSISSKEIVEKVKSLPTIYVEVNGDKQFTRFYTSGSLEAGTITVDFSLSYPTNVNVTEPEEYVDVQDIITGIFMSMFDYDYDYDYDVDILDEV